MHKNGAPFAYRLGFVLLCFLPTVIIVGWIAVRSLPGVVLSERQEWERELTRRLGLRFTCSAVKYTRPDTAELTNVSLFDLETNAPVATIATLEVIHMADRWKLVGWQVVADAAQLPLIYDRIDRQLLRRAPANDLANCEIWIRELTLRDGERSLTLVDVAGQWQATDQGPQGAIQFRLPEADPQAQPASLIVQRNRATVPPSTRYQFQTGAAPLPCSLAAAVWPSLRQIGNRAVFGGQGDFVHNGESVSGRISGVWQEIDLDALVSEQFPHHLRGLATCNVEDATIDQNRLVSIRGTVKARDGEISRSLLQAAQEHLQLASPLAASLPTGEAPVSFRQLSLGFDLRDTGLQLTGSAGLINSGALISCAAGSLLEAPPQHHVSSLAIIRTLVPQDEWQVAAARPAQTLARFLPTPDLTPSATASLGNPHIPTRLVPAGNGNSNVLRQPR